MCFCNRKFFNYLQPFPSMLREFIEANGLSAKIIPDRISSQDGAICKLFVSESNTLFLVVHRYHNKLDEAKLKAAFKELTAEEMHDAGPAEAERITGYSDEFMPPISIYGAHLLIDKKAIECEGLHFFTAKEETLVISAEEVIEMNEEHSVVDITKD